MWDTSGWLYLLVAVLRPTPRDVQEQEYQEMMFCILFESFILCAALLSL